MQANGKKGGIRHLRNFAASIIMIINALFAVLLLLSAYSPYLQPVTHPIASCFGLVFPIFILINGLFLCFWLIVQRYKYALLSLLAFLFCYSQIRTYLPLNFQAENPSHNYFKILSYNIMGFNNTVKEKDGNPILNYLKNSNADILCLQEYATVKSKRHISQEDVEKALKAYPYKQIQIVGSGKGHTNRIACYSKYPILSSRLIEYKSEYNGSVVYELKMGKDTIMLINNHLESNKLTKEDKVIYENIIKSPETEKVKTGARMLIKKLAEASAIRAPQADSVAKEIKQPKHSYILVCGDFNDTPISYTHRIIAQYLNDTFTDSGHGLGISYNQNMFYFRIDNILASKNFKSYNCTVDHSIKESDHYPIWCYLKKE